MSVPFLYEQSNVPDGRFAGPIAFAVWLGEHALSLVTTRAKVEAFIERPVCVPDSRLWLCPL